ncbi:MAG TPA: pyridoxamine 5'-phosphate oxidase family protein, partial [Polyangiaceae bacterium]|nr:pyridoxamine 5'-phosphate oxidase family protein [Polyangiaceae bacterium]
FGGRYDASVNLREVLEFVRAEALAVQASVTPTNTPQAAVIGIVVSDAFEVFFDTLESSRKCQNLRENPRIALVVGWDEKVGRTVQIEGVADEPTGAELERLKRPYFERFPDGVVRQSWPGITYVRVRPTWLRYSDFSGAEPRVVEYDASDLVAFAHAR